MFYVSKFNKTVENVSFLELSNYPYYSAMQQGITVLKLPPWSAADNFMENIMRDLFTEGYVDILAGQIVSGVAEQAETLSISSGCVWLTVEGVSQDYCLEAGDTLTVPAGRLVVMETISPCSLVRVGTGVRLPAPSQPQLSRERGAAVAA